jgi:hypothetical protein
VVNWEEQLRDINFDGLDGPPSFAQRLEEDPEFRAVAGGLVLAWPDLDKRRRNEALGALATLAVGALPETDNVAAIAQAVIQAIQHQAGAAFAAGDLPLESLRQIVGAVQPQAPRKAPAGPRALRYADAYYRDALTLSLPTWAARHWPDLAFEDNYDLLAARRRRARRTARRRGLQKSDA